MMRFEGGTVYVVNALGINFMFGVRPLPSKFT